ncbi:helix-turn-helix domain-containing protein [Streptomyces sp. NPDC014891]|uniref:helix-turn-helix domain-containing protein n=1 Tax=Streptomyces sp. NPDC014891 TaxID=3364929 RepID=UPI003702CEFF
MTDTPLSLAARLAADPDPARRFQLARAASEAAAAAAAAPFEDEASGALDELIAQHGGNVAAAAREVGLTAQALHKRVKRHKDGGATRPAPSAAEQPQPALRFESAEFAVTALENWTLRQQEITDQRDVFLLGALAAGVDPVTVAETTGVGLDTLRRIRPSGNITLSAIADNWDPVLEDFARAVDARAKALAADVTSSTTRAAHRVWWHTARYIVTNAAPTALMPDLPDEKDFASTEEYVEAMINREPTPEETAEDERQPTALAVADGADAFLAALWVEMRRQATTTHAPGGDEEIHAAHRQACGELADAIHHLRTTGQVPPSLTEGAA